MALMNCKMSVKGTHSAFTSISRRHVPRNATLSRHVARVGGFDEGAAQVRRLLDRDRKELDFDELEKSFADPNSSKPKEQPSSSTESATPSPSGGAQFAANKSPVSPFGPSAAAPSSIKSAGNSPFDLSSSNRSPFKEPSAADLSPEMPAVPAEPWWTRITLTQIVIVLSFTTIISLMIATFFLVVNMGAVRFNE